MFCPNCGNEMSESAAFCTNCGWSKSGGGAAGVKKFNIPVVPLTVIVLLFAVVFIIKNVFLGGNSYINQFETVTFGSYPQRDASGNKKEPIEWIVLDRQDGKTLLLSKYILDCKSYNNEQKEVTWETCSLRNWLNNDFYNQAFNSGEQGQIQTTNVVNNDNTKYKTKGGNNTNDKIFCLSINEAEKYFYQVDMQSENKKLATRGTNYAKNVKNGSVGLKVKDDFGEWYNGNSSFWLRSPGDFQHVAAYVIYDGYLADNGFIVGLQDGGVRPALWVEY